jgi:RNA-directed DNA polymerase
MKEPDGEGVASHTGPESCEGGGDAALEALTGVRAGWVLSLVMSSVGSADGFLIRGRQHEAGRYRKVRLDSPGSKTPCTHGHTSQGGGVRPCRRNDHFGDGSREISVLAPIAIGVRIVNPQGARR